MTKNCLLRSSCLSVNLETPCLNIRLSRATATSILVVMDCLVVEVETVMVEKSIVKISKSC